jgi:anti-anti-sigma factor
MTSPASEDRDRHSGWRRVAWAGEIDVIGAPAMLAQTLHGAHDGSRVVADLGSVQFMDAAGLGALVTARSLLRARCGDLLVRNPPPRVAWMLALFDLTDLIEPATQNATRGSIPPADTEESAAATEQSRSG